MTGSFLDTTVVIHIAEGVKPHSTKGEAFIGANLPAEAPFYALRELLTGRVRILCDTHNALLAAENVAEALLGIHKSSCFAGRTKNTKLEEIAKVMKSAFDVNPTGDREQLKREMLQALAIKANSLWRKSHRLKMVSLVQALACFNDGKVSYGSVGELTGPGNSFNCLMKERCAAAAYIYDNKSNLTKMIAALHPKNLDSKVANKNENTSRRKALKDLLSKGPKEFNKRGCRALGDAYFAAMCPPGSVVVTSNMDDHEPLCLALGKKAKEP